MLAFLLAALFAVSAWPATVSRPSPQAAVRALKAVFDPAGPSPLGPHAGPLLSYLASENRPAAGDPVVAAVRAEAAELLAKPYPVDAEARFRWAQRIAVLNAVRDSLDERQAEQILDRFSILARSRRADLLSMVEKATRDWMLGAQDLDVGAAVAVPHKPEGNVVRLTLNPRPTPPERRLRPDAAVYTMPRPETAAMIAIAKRMRDALGWTGLAVNEEKGEAVVSYHDSWALRLTLREQGVVVTFGQRPGLDLVDRVRAAGFDLRYTIDARTMELAVNGQPWFERWRLERLSLRHLTVGG